MAIILFVHCSFSSFAQSDPCIDIALFHELYDGNTGKIGNYLSENRWLLLSSETNEPLMLHQDTLLYNLAVWKNTRSSDDQYIYLYHNPGVSNYLEMVTSEDCFHSLYTDLQQKNRVIYENRVENDNIQSEIIISEQKHVLFQQQYKNSFSYHIICYNPVELDSLILSHREEKLQAQLIYQQKREHVEKLLKQSHSLAQKNNYEGALVMIDTLRGYLSEYDQEIEERIEKYREEIKKQKIASLTAQAEQLFEDRNLQAAMNLYEDIQLLDNKNQTAEIRISQIKKMLDVLYLRADIMYDYKTLNPDSWHLIQNQLQAGINNTVKREKWGSLDFSFTIYMDTIGRNSSFYSISPQSESSFDKFLKDLAISPLLKPTFKESISVASKYNFKYNISWKTINFDLKKKKRNVSVPLQYNYLLNNETFKTYINNSDLPIGRYVFEIKEKRVDSNAPLVDVTLKKYKVVGREAFFYSLLLPGVGTMAATQGKKGYFSFISFFAAGGCSLAAYLQADRLDADAQRCFESNPTRSADLTKAAKNVRIASYIGFSVTGVIYISEAIRAMVKGGQNMKASKTLRRSIKYSPQEIITQEITL